MTVYALNMWDVAPENCYVIDSTSHGPCKMDLSPFFLGPCDLYDGFVAQNVEGGWQFSKAYSIHLGDDGLPNASYWEWAKCGWADKRAQRYPMGKHAVPIFSYWENRCLDYIQARKMIYVPLYAEQVIKTRTYADLARRYERGEDIAIRSFDAYRNDLLGFSLSQVLNNPSKKMGHAFVIAMLLTNDASLKECAMRRVEGLKGEIFTAPNSQSMR